MEFQLNLNDFQSDQVCKQDFMKYFYDKTLSATLNWGLQMTIGLEECGVERNQNIILVDQGNDVYTGPSDYYGCLPLPEVWIQWIHEKKKDIQKKNIGQRNLSVKITRNTKTQQLRDNFIKKNSFEYTQFISNANASTNNNSKQNNTRVFSYHPNKGQGLVQNKSNILKQVKQSLESISINEVEQEQENAGKSVLKIFKMFESDIDQYSKTAYLVDSQRVVKKQIYY